MRIIDADTLKEAVSNSPLIDFDDYAIFEIIDKVQTVTIKEWKEEMPIYIKDAMLEALRPQGEWITFSTNHSIIQCSECTALLNNSRVDVFKDDVGKMNFCPNCGAYMKGVNAHD